METSALPSVEAVTNGAYAKARSRTTYFPQVVGRISA